MRSVLLIALVFACIVGLTAAKNCSQVMKPSILNNVYQPPQDCVATDTGIQGCFSTYDSCVAIVSNVSNVNVSKCDGLEICFSTKMRCLERTTATSPNCTLWSTSMSNIQLYLMAGGMYAESNLARSCEYEACQMLSVQSDTSKPCETVNFTGVCSQPNFDTPTQAPGQASFSITFGGDWAAILEGAPKDSAKYKALEVAVAKGLAKLLNTQEYLIQILDMKLGSLIVDFIVNDPNIDIATITAKLQAAVDDPSLVTAAFTALATTSGMPIEVSGFGVVDPSSPAPVTPSPPQTIEDEVSCNSGCVAGVVVGIIIFLIILAIVTVVVLRPSSDDGSGRENEPVEHNAQHDV